MKRIVFILTALLAISLTACSQNNKKDMKKQNVLVAYFSATGTTEAVAKRLAEVTGGKLYEIQPEKPYTADDLNWNNDNSRANRESKIRSTRPAIKGKVENFDSYDVVYVGFPIWWYTCPTIINTFMESYDFKGKTVIPFATSGGSSIKKSCQDLKADYPNVNWKEGRLLNGASEKQLQDWINKQ